MFFISLSNNREYFSKQKFNRYFNPYPYYLLAERRALRARLSALFIALMFENYERYFFFL